MIVTVFNMICGVTAVAALSTSQMQGRKATITMGGCPRRKLACPPMPGPACASDWDCDTVQLCCPTRCRASACIQPVESRIYGYLVLNDLPVQNYEEYVPEPTKPTTTPKPCPTVGPCLGLCMDDTVCGSGELCCGGCCKNYMPVGYPKTQEKAGFCPLLDWSAPSSGRCQRNCHDDFDCGRVLKCCRTKDCGNNCVAPSPAQFACPHPNVSPTPDVTCEVSLADIVRPCISAHACITAGLNGLGACCKIPGARTAVESSIVSISTDLCLASMVSIQECFERGKPFRTRFVYNKHSGQCEWAYRCIHGLNNFSSKSVCEERCTNTGNNQRTYNTQRKLPKVDSTSWLSSAENDTNIFFRG